MTSQLVELPGIEPRYKNGPAETLNLATRNDAKVRETTCGRRGRC